jgi:hypothetical protein
VVNKVRALKCGYICKNARYHLFFVKDCSSDKRRFSGLQQLHGDSKNDNLTCKGRNDQLEELKCDMAELILLLKQAIRQSVKEVISIEINIISAKIESLCKTVNEQSLIEPRWSEVASGRYKRNYSDTYNNTYRIPVIINRYELPSGIEVNETQISNLTGKQEIRKTRIKQILSKKKKHKIVIIGDSYGRECASKLTYNLVNEFKVQGIIKPEAAIKAITNTVKEARNKENTHKANTIKKEETQDCKHWR